MREIKSLEKIGKKILGKKYALLKKIKDKEERTEVLKYVITSDLKLKKASTEYEISKMKNKNSFIDAKVALLDSKIKFFEVSFQKKDYDCVIRSIEEAEREIKNVRTF